jgi:tRNA threonylcarbamoyladenosine biosynthesis protein TsaB
MKLYIDTSSSEEITIKLGNKSFTTDARTKKAQALLPFIVQSLKKEKKTLKDISEIEVFPGPGSFTGLRVGVAIGNALSWSLGLPGRFSQINYHK